MLDDPIPPLKRQLADAILAVAQQTNFHVAAAALGIDAARLSDLRRGRIERFSVERLIRLLAVVDRSVEVTITPEGGVRVRWFAILRARRARAAMDQTLGDSPLCRETVGKQS